MSLQVRLREAVLVEDEVQASEAVSQDITNQLRVHLYSSATEEGLPRRTGDEELDAVVYLVEEVRPERPLCLELLEEPAHFRDVDQFAWVVVVSVDHEAHLTPVQPGVLAGSSEHLEPSQD